MTVKKMYEMDTYLFESEAVVTALGEEEGKKFFQLDQSIFYPQGGGQPSDTGTCKQHANSYFLGVLDPSKGPEPPHLPAPAVPWPPLDLNGGVAAESTDAAAG